MPKHIEPQPVDGARRFYSREQARVAIGCDARTLARLISSGRIREVELGGLRRIPATELDRIAAEASA